MNRRMKNVSQFRRERRNRRVTQFAFLFVLIFIIGACLTGFTNKSTVDDTKHEKYFTSITIEDGDSLWSIAEQNMTKEYVSVDSYIEEVQEINHLTSDSITEGRHLVIPHYTTE